LLGRLDDPIVPLSQKCESVIPSGGGTSSSDDENNNANNNNQIMMASLIPDAHERLRITKTCSTLSQPIVRFCRTYLANGRDFNHVSSKFWLMFCPKEKREGPKNFYELERLRTKERRRAAAANSSSSIYPLISNNNNHHNNSPSSTSSSMWVGAMQTSYTRATSPIKPHIQWHPPTTTTTANHHQQVGGGAATTAVAAAVSSTKQLLERTRREKNQSHSSNNNNINNSAGSSSFNNDAPGEWYFVGSQSMQHNLRHIASHVLVDFRLERESHLRRQQQLEEQRRKYSISGGVNSSGVGGANKKMQNNLDDTDDISWDVSSPPGVTNEQQQQQQQDHHHNGSSALVLVDGNNHINVVPSIDEMWAHRIRHGGPRRAIITADYVRTIRRLEQKDRAETPSIFRVNNNSNALVVVGEGGTKSNNNNSSTALALTPQPGTIFNKISSNNNSKEYTPHKNRFLSRLGRFLGQEQNRLFRKEQQQVELEEQEREAALRRERELEDEMLRKNQKNNNKNNGDDEDDANNDILLSASLQLSPSNVRDRNKSRANLWKALASPVFVSPVEKIRVIYDVKGFYDLLEASFLDLFSERLDNPQRSSQLELVKGGRITMSGGADIFDTCSNRPVRMSSEIKAKEAIDFFADMAIMAELDEDDGKNYHYNNNGNDDDDDEEEEEEQEQEQRKEEGKNDDDHHDDVTDLKNKNKRKKKKSSLFNEMDKAGQIEATLARKAPHSTVTIHIPDNSRVGARILAATLWKAESIERVIEKLSRWQIEMWWHMFQQGTATLHRSLDMVLFQREESSLSSPPPTTTNNVAGGGAASSSSSPTGAAATSSNSPPGGSGIVVEGVEGNNNNEIGADTTETDENEAAAAAMKAHAARLVQIHTILTEEESTRSRILGNEASRKRLIFGLEFDHRGFLREFFPEWIAAAAVVHRQQQQQDDTSPALSLLAEAAIIKRDEDLRIAEEERERRAELLRIQRQKLTDRLKKRADLEDRFGPVERDERQLKAAAAVREMVSIEIWMRRESLTRCRIYNDFVMDSAEILTHCFSASSSSSLSSTAKREANDQQQSTTAVATANLPRALICRNPKCSNVRVGDLLWLRQLVVRETLLSREASAREGISMSCSEELVTKIFSPFIIALRQAKIAHRREAFRHQRAVEIERLRLAFTADAVVMKHEIAGRVSMTAAESGSRQIILKFCFRAFLPSKKKREGEEEEEEDDKKNDDIIRAEQEVLNIERDLEERRSRSQRRRDSSASTPSRGGDHDDHHRQRKQAISSQRDLTVIREMYENQNMVLIQETEQRALIVDETQNEMTSLILLLFRPFFVSWNNK